MAVDVMPIRAEMPASEAPIGAAIALKRVARLAVDSTVVKAPVVTANALIIVLARLYFLLILR